MFNTTRVFYNNLLRKINNLKALQIIIFTVAFGVNLLCATQSLPGTVWPAVLLSTSISWSFSLLCSSTVCSICKG